MNKENDEPWRNWEVEDWERDICKQRHIMNIDHCYISKEERAKGAYFQLMMEEKGDFRQTWMEIIEERSATRKLMKKREKEEYKENGNSDEPGK